MEYAAPTFFFSVTEIFTQLKSWFFTLAHEIAHNLVQQHDAEVCDNLPKSHIFFRANVFILLQHSFYFSAISQKHVSGLYDLLQKHGA